MGSSHTKAPFKGHNIMHHKSTSLKKESPSLWRRVRLQTAFSSSPKNAMPEILGWCPGFFGPATDAAVFSNCMSIAVQNAVEGTTQVLLFLQLLFLLLPLFLLPFWQATNQATNHCQFQSGGVLDPPCGPPTLKI